MMDQYDEILNYYGLVTPIKIDDLIWINKKIIELSQNRPKSLSMNKYINCLILIQNLFMTDIPDYCNYKGKPRKLLDHNEKRIFVNILKEEFSN